MEKNTNSPGNSGEGEKLKGNMPGRKRRAPTPSSDSSSSADTSSSGSSDRQQKVKEITANLLPSKSRKLYEKTYDDFLSFTKIRGKDPRQPTEDEILLYLHDLAENKKLAYKTLWQRYSMIKSAIQTHHDVKLDHKRVTAYLKRQEEQCTVPTKKASVFTPAEVLAYLKTDTDSELGIISRAYFSLTYYGGLRSEESYNLQKHDLVDDDDFGTWVTYQPAKQRGAKKRAVFLVPKGPAQDTLKTYLKTLSVAALACKFLWHAINYIARGKARGFRAARWGINSCRQVTIHAATTLKLQNPNTYTGHALRRSAATHLADKGRSPADLMRFFGWTSMSTAQQYLDRSKHMLQSLAEDLSLKSEPADSLQNSPPDSDLASDIPAPLQTLTQAHPVAPPNVFYFSNIGEGAVIQIGTDAIKPKPHPKRN